MKSNRVYIDQILDSISKVESFAEKISREDFFTNSLVQSGIIMQLTLIGEISKKVSEDLKGKINLPWKEIAGFRDKAIHDYFEINLDVVWDTIVMDLPQLKKELQKIPQ